MTTVVHIDDAPADGYYIGRGSPAGNPFVIGRDGNRGEVLAKFRQYIRYRVDLLDLFRSLRGRTLICHCKPKDCHGDIIAEIADDPYADLLG